MSPGQHPEPAAQGEAGHAHCGARPARHRQALRGEPVVHVNQLQAGATVTVPLATWREFIAVTLTMSPVVLDQPA